MPFVLHEPRGPLVAAVFNSPHSGAEYPQGLLERSRLSPLALRGSEDVKVDALFSAAPVFGAPLLAATAPRAWVDLNRGPGELDPALIDGAQSAGLNQRIAAGLGVIPRIVAEGTPIYDGKITMAEAEMRIQSVHVPYHRKLDALMIRARKIFGTALLIDCHSMPSEALRAAPRQHGQRPEIVLGDRFGASASRVFVEETREAFEAVGFVVTRNAPFAGGYITQRFGRPSRSMHAVQIEIDRALYLDQNSLEPLASFADVQKRITQAIAKIVSILPRPQSLAAE